MAHYSILQQGDPLLLRPAQPMTQPRSRSLDLAQGDRTGSWPFQPPRPPQESDVATDLQELIDDLIALTLAQNGVGIAAPQVGLSERLMIVASRPNARYPDAPLMDPTAMINPRLLDRSDQEVGGWEGCLSLPGQRGWVPRANWIQVEYWDRLGDRQTGQLQGFIARIFQHELDHLDGILFPQRVRRAEDLVSEVTFLERLSRRD